MTISAAMEQLMQLLATVLGFAALPDLSATQLAALALTAALFAVSVLAVAVTIGMVRTGQGSSPHPLRAIGRSVLLSQSDPDAAGHPRPRAPGAAPAV
ncbi:DUF6412 domain-containing protein [Microbacterium sp. GXF6406]